MARTVNKNDIYVGSFVQFAPNQAFGYDELGMNFGFVMVVTEVDHWDNTITVAYQNTNGDQLTYSASAQLFKLASIHIPSNVNWENPVQEPVMVDWAAQRYDDSEYAIKQTMRMERAQYRRMWRAMMELYAVNMERVNYVELTTALFNVTIHKATVEEVAAYCGPSVSLFAFGYASIAQDFREQFFMSHMAEIRHISLGGNVI